MKDERKILKTILYILRSKEFDDPKLTDIEYIVGDSGEIIGCKFELKDKERPKLSLVKNEDD
jgi:hypothetical protein